MQKRIYNSQKNCEIYWYQLEGIYYNFQVRFESLIYYPFRFILTLKDPLFSESWIEIKIKLNFYFPTSLWCLKRFHEGLKGLYETFRGTTKKCENKNWT